ncbi:unnamed protein product [Albugo candida]|uniref:TRAF-type domain-containing protein n=1 Tax=Albugo candida TaxID=65357 RepID=A0A024GTE2_9STRA|nr:unnamed protein product [Albugo candida]|eukprot:CCI50058.1 unnamed protein product [Albugo candida]
MDRLRQTLESDACKKEEVHKRQLYKTLLMHSDELERLNFETTSISHAVHALNRKQDQSNHELTNLQAQSNEIFSFCEKDAAWRQLQQKRWLEVQQTVTSVFEKHNSIQESLKEKVSGSELVMQVKTFMEPIKVKLQTIDHRQTQQIGELAHSTSTLSLSLDSVMGNVNKLQCFDMVNLRKELSDLKSYCMKQGTTAGNQPERTNKFKFSEVPGKLGKEIGSACQSSAFEQIEIRSGATGAEIRKECIDYIDAECQEIHASVLRQMREISKETIADLKDFVTGTYAKNMKNDIQSHFDASMAPLFDRYAGLESRTDSISRELNQEFCGIKERFDALEQQSKRLSQEITSTLRQIKIPCHVEDVKLELEALRKSYEKDISQLLRKMDMVEERFEELIGSLSAKVCDDRNTITKHMHLDERNTCQLGGSSPVQSGTTVIESILHLLQAHFQSPLQSKRTAVSPDAVSLIDRENDLDRNIKSSVDLVSNVSGRSLMPVTKCPTEDTNAPTEFLLSVKKDSTASKDESIESSERRKELDFDKSTSKKLPNNTSNHPVGIQEAITRYGYPNQEIYMSELQTEADTAQMKFPERWNKSDNSTESASTMPEYSPAKYMSNERPTKDNILFPSCNQTRSAFERDVIDQLHHEPIAISRVTDVNHAEGKRKLELQTNVQSKFNTEDLDLNIQTRTPASPVSTSGKSQYASQECRFCSLNMNMSDIIEHELTCGLLPKQCPHCLKRQKALNLAEHIKICEYRIVACTLKCGAKFLQRDLAKHLSTRCHLQSEACTSFDESIISPVLKNRFKDTCEFCNKIVAFRELENHYMICEKKPSNCQFCNASLLKEEMPCHEASCKQKSQQHRFRSLRYNGKDLTQLTETNLINDLGVNNRLQRQRLMDAIQELRRKHNIHDSDTEDEDDIDEA